MKAEVTVDNTSIRVSWQWSRQGLPMCVDLVRVHYQPKRGSLMMYTVSSTTATSATLPNLQCDTEYTIWLEARGSRTGKRSTSRVVFLPARGIAMQIVCNQNQPVIQFTLHSSVCMIMCSICTLQSFIQCTVFCTTVLLQLLPFLLRSLLSSQVPQLSG